MQKIVGVRFRKAGKIYFFDPTDDIFEKGDFVVVDTSRGLECGKIVVGIKEIPEAEIPEICNNSMPPILRKIHRKATKADMARLKENREKEKDAFKICLEKIADNDLPMKLINVNYTFDMSKIIFYFTADGRVDFRELVKDLAYIFHTRIELRQVGVRDEAKVLGGTGCCGRPLCCANFLGDFAPVSIKMAKEQNLSLNPAKISGICGRLLCCLKYESEYYHEKYMENFKSFVPERGDRVILDEGEGRIVAVNEIYRTAVVYLDTRRSVTANWDDILPVAKKTDTQSNSDFDEEESAEEIAELAEISNETEKVVASEKPQQAENFNRRNNFNKTKNFSRQKNFDRNNFENSERQNKNFNSRNDFRRTRNFDRNNFENPERQNEHFNRGNNFRHNQSRRFGDYKK